MESILKVAVEVLVAGVSLVVDEKLEGEDGENIKEQPGAEIVLEDLAARGHEVSIIGEVGGVECNEDVEQEEHI